MSHYIIQKIKKTLKSIADKYDASKILINVTGGEPLVRQDLFEVMKFEKEIRKNMFFCTAGYTTASILYNGDIYVCPNVERRKELIQGNVKQDDFVQIWENKFKWFRDLDKLKCNDCAKCENWKYCRGDSLHTWNFEKNNPKLCLNKILDQL